MINLLGYNSDGEASDWMLAEKGILAFSPELGSEDERSESFYPDILVALEILRENLTSAIFAIQKSSYSFILNGIRTFNDKNNNDIYNMNNYPIFNSFSNYNNDNYYYWGYCKDLNENYNLTMISNNEFNLIYYNDYFNDICSENFENYKFYTISASVFNEGLEKFKNKAKVKIKFSSKGFDRINGNFIKFYYSNSTILHLGSIFDSKNITSSQQKIIIENKDNIADFEYNFTIHGIESNATILFDMKLFTDRVKEKNNTIFFNLDIEFIYYVQNKFYRTYKIHELKESDLKYFNAEKNMFANKIFNSNSLETYNIAYYDDKFIYSSKKNNNKIVAIVISIFLLMVISLLILLFLIKKIQKQAKNKVKLKKNKINIHDKEKNNINIPKSLNEDNNHDKNSNIIEILNLNTNNNINKESIRNEVNIPYFNKINDKSKNNYNNDKVEIITIIDDKIEGSRI